MACAIRIGPEFLLGHKLSLRVVLLIFISSRLGGVVFLLLQSQIGLDQRRVLAGVCSLSLPDVAARLENTDTIGHFQRPGGILFYQQNSHPLLNQLNQDNGFPNAVPDRRWKFWSQAGEDSTTSRRRTD